MSFIDRSPLQYNINSTTSIRRFKDVRDPTVADFKQFTEGDLWLNSSTNSWWICAKKDATSAVWEQFASITASETFTVDTGTVVTANPATNNIDFLGNSGAYKNGMLFSGDAVNYTISAKDLRNITKYVVDPTADETEYTTIQSALDAANAAGGASCIWVRPGTYTEDLTFYDGIDLWGAVGVADTQTCKIIGKHTPPASGTLTVRNIFLESATHIFDSAVAGTSDLILLDVAVNVTNGYTFNLPNWTGSFTGFDIGEIGSTNDGWINNTGGAYTFMVNITMGSGSGNPMITSGGIELYNCSVKCPSNFGNGTTGTANGGCFFQDTVTFSGNADVDLSNSIITTGANQALVHNSTADIYLANITIDSTNAPAIGGTGAGNLIIGSVTYLNNSNIAATVTKSFATRLETGELKLDDADNGILVATNGVVSTGGGTPSLDNILYVGKHGDDANSGESPFLAKLTIQAAVTAAAAGDGIIVYPGTYTETVTHAANNVTLRAQGKPGTCVITQADANVIDVNTQTGIFYDGFRIACTAATTAINTVQLSTGSVTFRACRLEMYCAAAIAAVAQPAIGAVTGAGTMIVAFGRHKYEHTGNGGGTAQKGAFKVGTGGEVDLTRIEEFDIVNSGTALATTVGIDTATTGFFKMNGCNVEITDPDATVLAGLAYLGGTGTENEFRRNTIHINATNNVGYGFYAADTASTSRFFYNHIHVTDVAGTSYSYHVGNTATVVSVFDDIIADDGIDLVAGGTFTCTSSLVDGDLTCRGREATGVVQASVMNMDNTAAAGNAAVNISVGGTTSTGDPYTQWLITGSTAFSAGIDNSDADAFKIGSNVNPSTGSSDIEIAAATGAVTFNEAYTFPTADGAADQVLTTDGSGAVTWQDTAVGFTWSNISASGNLVVNTGVNCTGGAALSLALPATSAVGAIIEVVLDGSTSWTITQGAGQQIRFGAFTTTAGAGGSLASTAQGDAIKMICKTADTIWTCVTGSIGNITIV